MNQLTPVKQVKLKKWMDIIRDCQNSGKPVSQYCNEHNISTSNYHYYLSKIRKIAVDQFPVVPKKETKEEIIPFTEIKEEELKNEIPLASKVIIRKGDAVIEIPNDISDSLLSKILRSL